jgi:hypothetical protein
VQLILDGSFCKLLILWNLKITICKLKTNPHKDNQRYLFMVFPVWMWKTKLKLIRWFQSCPDEVFKCFFGNSHSWLIRIQFKTKKAPFRRFVKQVHILPDFIFCKTFRRIPALIYNWLKLPVCPGATLIILVSIFFYRLDLEMKTLVTEDFLN